MATVILVRHGRTTANATGVLAGRTEGVTLDDVGREQAARTGERLAVVDRGTVLREWPHSGPRSGAEIPVLDPYQHHVPGYESSGTFLVVDGEGGRRGPDGRWISHSHDSYAAALAEASTMSERRVLVVRLIEELNWH